MGENSRKRKQRHLDRASAKSQTPAPKSPLVARTGLAAPAGVDIVRRANEFFSRPDLVPGCYDDPDFQALERLDRTVLERYALHVLTEGAKRNSGRDDAIRGVVERFSAALAAMSPAESIGQCVHIAAKLIRSLEMIGVWCFGTKGATSAYTTDGKNPDGTHFYAIDDVDFRGGTPGHLWVVAPPFMVIDCSIFYQGWEPTVRVAMDRLVLSRTPISEAPDFNKLAAPTYRGDPRARAKFAQLRQTFWPWLNCFRVELERVRLHYVPYGVMLPLEPATAYTFGGHPLTTFIEGL